MKRLVAVFVMVFIAGFCFGADPAEGFWISIDDKTGKTTAGWEVYVVDGKLFGKVVSVSGHPQDVKATNCPDSFKDFPVPGKVNQMTVVGTPWVFGLSVDKNRPGFWSGGKVIDPDEGKMYTCEVTFHKSDGKKFQTDTLEMRGKILMFGRSQFWKKSTKEEASGLR